MVLVLKAFSLTRGSSSYLTRCGKPNLEDLAHMTFDGTPEDWADAGDEDLHQVLPLEMALSEPANEGKVRAE